jgi:hypothetical protein
LAVSGMMMPPLVFSSPSRRLIMTRSCKGRNAMSFPFCSRLQARRKGRIGTGGKRISEKRSLAPVCIECQQAFAFFDGVPLSILYDNLKLPWPAFSTTASASLPAPGRLADYSSPFSSSSDRLTRSLADFAKLVELFDEHGVSPSRSRNPSTLEWAFLQKVGGGSSAAPLSRSGQL